MPDWARIREPKPCDCHNMTLVGACPCCGYGRGECPDCGAVSCGVEWGYPSELDERLAVLAERNVHDDRPWEFEDRGILKPRMTRVETGGE